MKRSSSVKLGDLHSLGQEGVRRNTTGMEEESLFELDDAPTGQLEVAEQGRARSEAGSSSWGSECSYHECLGAGDSDLSWVIADLENASAMAWRTLTAKGTATLANLAHLLAHATLGRATVRTGLGAGSAVESMTQLRHSFLLCRHPRAAQTDLIVDPNFKDQFTISRADEEFTSFLDTVPQMFVGTAAMLRASVRVCSDIMADALDRAKMPRAPWREQHALLSKWAPLHWRDELYLGVCIQGPGLSPAGSSAAAIVAATRPGAAPTPASITIHSTKHGSQVVEVSKQQPQPQQSRPPRVSVVRVSDAPPRTSIVGFKARGSSSGTRGASGGHGHSRGSGAAGAGACMHELHQFLPPRSPASSAVSSLAVSSLSDELMVVQRMERKGEARSNKDVSIAKASKGGASQAQSRAPSGPTTPQAPGMGGAGAQAPAKPVSQLASCVAAVQPSRLAAAGLYRPLDQLLPTIRTVKLGRI